jgi:hypothetical protein
MSKIKIIASLFLLSTLVSRPSTARAASNTLQAIVRPGYVYGALERPTTSTLNRLGNPTIEITGTIDGTAGINAGTVTGTLLSDSVPGTNLTYDGSSPRKLVIKNSGVGSNQLDSAISGFGLTGGGGAYLKVNIDSNSIVSTATGDTLQINTNLHGMMSWTSNTLFGAISYPTNAFGTNIFGGTNNIATNGPITLPAGWFITGSNTLFAAGGFVSNESNLVAGVVCDVAHGLGATPGLVRWVLVCQTNDAGYSASDELNLRSVQRSDGTATHADGANATNVFLTFLTSTLQVANKSTGAYESITTARWRAKVYARP